MKKRQPFIGVKNVINFNRHLFGLAILCGLVMFLAGYFTNHLISILFFIGGSLSFIMVFCSLFATYIAYDYSGMYDLAWIKPYFKTQKNSLILNLHAGLDEISTDLRFVFSDAEVKCFTYYRALSRKEKSIIQANKNQLVDFCKETEITSIPVKDQQAGLIINFLAAHEIRNFEERIEFFKEQNRVLSNQGKILVIEHCRDFWNFLAYTIGFLHFFSEKSWYKCFKSADLEFVEKRNFSPFITVFILVKNADTP